MVTEINDRNFDSEVVKATGPVMVDFYADLKFFVSVLPPSVVSLEDYFCFGKNISWRKHVC